MLSSSSSGSIPPPRERINGSQNQSNVNGNDMSGSGSGEASTSTLSTSRSRVFDRLKPWKTSTSTSVAGRRKPTIFGSGSKKEKEKEREQDQLGGDPYTEQIVASTSAGPSESPGRRSENGEGYEWEEGSEDEGEPDAYSWIDPSVVGTSALGHSSPIGDEGVRSPGVASSLLQGPLSPVITRDPPHVSLFFFRERNEE